MRDRNYRLWQLKNNEWVKIRPAPFGGVTVEVWRRYTPLLAVSAPLSPIGPQTCTASGDIDEVYINGEHLSHGNEWHAFDDKIGYLLERMDLAHGTNLE